MLAAVAIGSALSYPTVFLAGDPTAGFTSMPRHAWTTARSVEEQPTVQADVEMRQIWVHGSYMRALEKEVLQSALTIQQTLVGGEKLTTIFPTLSDKLRSGSLPWGYHSPLMYWNNSGQAIEDDVDILRTINDQAKSASSLNVGLRPASVFAGKSFDNRRLQAADALVITLVNKFEDNVGIKWQDKMHSLAGNACPNCTVYPPNGQVSRSRLYQFSFTPLSFRENVAFACAYGFMALYVLMSLRRIKAFHSRAGLVVTAITQITTSILASFTICGILKINLASVPRNAYPFVVLVIGIENMFRLINAVLAYPPTTATDLRIANALGDVGPLSVATAAQNLALLWFLSRVVSPGVAAFCAFAAIATVFDSFFLLTFFVAVLMVDIRRLELQDSLHRTNARSRPRRASPSQRTWFDALVHGGLPVSTRMAGTVVTTTFVISLNYHFFEYKNDTTTLRQVFGLFKSGGGSIDQLDTFAPPPPMNATLTPGEWMRMQDFDTAREVMRLVKPGAHSFIIRVFSPLIVVLSDSDRTGNHDGRAEWIEALRSFALHHLYPSAVAVVFVVAFVAVLMNFLLYTAVPDDDALDDERNRQRLSADTISLPHRLDIVDMACGSNECIVSVGLDRSIVVTRFDRSRDAYLTHSIPFEALRDQAWPPHKFVADASGEQLAIHWADDAVSVSESAAGYTDRHHVQYPDDNPSLVFDFARLATSEGTCNFFVCLTSGGRLALFNIGSRATDEFRISHVPLLGAALVEPARQGQRLVTINENAVLSAHTLDGSYWSLQQEKPMPLDLPDGSLQGAVSIKPYRATDCEFLVIAHGSQILFVDARSFAVLSKMDHGNAIDLARGGVVVGEVSRCAICRSPSLRSFAYLAEGLLNKECILVNASARSGDAEASLCLKPGAKQCQTPDKATATQNKLPDAGTWRLLESGIVLGLRKRKTEISREELANRAAAARQPRHRRHDRAHSRRHDESPEVWEGYSFSTTGEFKSVEVEASSSEASDAATDDALYVNSAGPIVSLDAHSVAVAFGNVVRVIKTTRRGSVSRVADDGALEKHSSVVARKRLQRKAQ
ncbi:hypothetical protein MBLNU230_g1059t1 [Neophaeotheca triangularis]